MFKIIHYFMYTYFFICLFFSLQIYNFHLYSAIRLCRFSVFCDYNFGELSILSLQTSKNFS